MFTGLLPPYGIPFSFSFYHLPSPVFLYLHLLQMIATGQHRPKQLLSGSLSIAAKAVSYIFHPLFVPVYVGAFFIYVLRYFPQLDEWGRTKLLISFIVNYMVLPLATLLLGKGLGFIGSVYLRTQKDRIIPYVATGIFYFWVWYVFKNQSFPKPLVMFSLAVFLASSIGLLLNSYMKVSMHAIAMGVVAALFIFLGFSTYENMGPYISAVWLVAGLVCTARLVNNDHHPVEVYVGFAAGVIALVIASFFS
jgi:hypothetical protein